MIALALLLAVRLVPATAGVEYRQPQLAVGGGLVGVTFGAGNTVYFAASRDQGQSFSSPVKVGGCRALSLGNHRGPRLAITPGAIVTSAVVDQNLTAWRSTDGGKSWSAGIAVNDVPTAAREGLHAMAAGANGVVFAAWLDLRSGHTELYGAQSKDGGATWSKNVLVYRSPDGHICECCHPSVAIDAKGNVYVMWRNWLHGARDMYLARSNDGGHSFQAGEKVGEGTWPLNACPMDGGGLALDSEGSVVSVFRRGETVYLARPKSAETELARGRDASIAAGPEGVYAAWAAGGVRARFPGKPEPVLLAEDGAAVTLAGSGPVFAAWESKGAIVVRSLIAP